MEDGRAGKVTSATKGIWKHLDASLMRDGKFGRGIAEVQAEPKPAARVPRTVHD